MSKVFENDLFQVEEIAGYYFINQIRDFKRSDFTFTEKEMYFRNFKHILDADDGLYRVYGELNKSIFVEMFYELKDELQNEKVERVFPFFSYIYDMRNGSLPCYNEPHYRWKNMFFMEDAKNFHPRDKVFSGIKKTNTNKRKEKLTKLWVEGKKEQNKLIDKIIEQASSEFNKMIIRNNNECYYACKHLMVDLENVNPEFLENEISKTNGEHDYKNLKKEEEEIKKSISCLQDQLRVRRSSRKELERSTMLTTFQERTETEFGKFMMKNLLKEEPSWTSNMEYAFR